jgi:hypothetical protein
MAVESAIVSSLRPSLADRAGVVAENPAQRQQLAVLQVSMRRPPLHKRARVCRVWLLSDSAIRDVYRDFRTALCSNW